MALDAVAIGLLAAALLLRVLRRDSWAGFALGLAVATKFLPAAAAPVLWRRPARWRTALATVVSIAALYAIYSGVGTRIFGFLGGYGSEEGYDSGEGLWLLAGLSRVIAPPEWAAALYTAAAVVVLGASAAWIMFVRRLDDPVAICRAPGAMMALLTFVVSPHYPWYFAWLAEPCVLAPSPAVLWMATGSILLYLDTFGDRLFWPSVVYLPTIASIFACPRLSPAPNRSGKSRDADDNLERSAPILRSCDGGAAECR